MFQKVQQWQVDEEYAGQRLDNYLFARCKGVPKSRLYRAIRDGEVRINGKRAAVSARLQPGDVLRIPPLHVVPEAQRPLERMHYQLQQLERRIIFEDDDVLVLNKPSGWPVHGGTGESHGIIDVLRTRSVRAQKYELVHRLDKFTSGCLLIAKKRSVLRPLQDYLRQQTFQKEYVALVQGFWDPHLKIIDAPLHKHHLSSGEHRVRVDEVHGKASETRFKVLQPFESCTLVRAQLITGRTHQIRVHAACVGHPVAGDDKYGENEFNAEMKRTYRLNRLFLHAASLSIPSLHNPKLQCRFESELDVDLKEVLDRLTPLI